MDDAEKRKLAAKMDEEYKKSDAAIKKSMDKDALEYLEGEVDSYMYGKVEDLPDSFGLRLRKHLLDGGKPSEFFKANIAKFKGYISEELLPYFYRSLDMVNEWQTEWYSYGRRSYRGGSDYTLYLKRFKDIINEYREITRYGVDIYSLYTGELPENLRIYFSMRTMRRIPDYYIAAKLDEGDAKLEELITETFYGETGDVEINTIRGIFLSKNEKMYEVLGKTLVAARLSEGLRQSICENMDFGTKEGQLYMLKVIEDNDLVRFSSVRRALSTFTGIFAVDTKDETRISKKLLNLIVRAFSDEKEIEKMLESEDSMEIFMALWAIGNTDIRTAMQRAVKLARTGSRHQRLTACYFLVKIPIPYAISEHAKEIVREFNDDDEILANIMPAFMHKVGDKIYDLMYGRHGRYNYVERRDRVSADYRKYFDSPDECREFLDLMYKIMDRIPKKGVIFEESVFPWNKETLSRSDLAIRIAYCASALKDDAEIIKAAGLLKEINGDAAYYRPDVMEMLLRQPTTPEMLHVLTEELADAHERTREMAYLLMHQEMTDDRSDAPEGVAAPAGRLPEKCYDILEGMLRLKKADLRENVLLLLATRGPEEKLEMLKRLLSDGKEEKVTAGLDIILQLKKNDDVLFKDAAGMLECIEKPTTKEQVLIDEIQGSKSEEDSVTEDFYDKNAEYTPVIDEEYMSEALDAFYYLFPDSEVSPERQPKKKDMASVEKDFEFIHKLDDLIEANKDKEYEMWDGRKELLGNGLYAASRLSKGGENSPFADLWDAFIAENEISDGQLYALNLLYDYYGYRPDVNGYYEYFMPLMSKIFGPVFAAENAFDLKHIQQIHVVLGYLTARRELSKKYRSYIAAVVANFLNTTKESTEYEFTYEKYSNSYTRSQADKNKTYRRSVLEHYIMRDVLTWLRADDRNFPIHCMFKNGIVTRHAENESIHIASYASAFNAENGKGPHSVDYIGAYACGYISRDYMYKALLDESRIKEAVETVSNLEKFIRESDQTVSSRGSGYYSYKINDMAEQLLKCKASELSGIELSDIQKKKLEAADKCYEDISKLIMNKELVRGDTATEYSAASLELSRVYGLNYLVRILSALGNETLDRTSFFYGYANRSTTKRESMSHLLSVCIPDSREGDAKEQAAKLKELLKGTDIKESRLIEAGLYSPEWLPIIAEYLGWEGFMSGCYYFMAHMNEKFDDKRAAIIAKYTPLTEEELNVGAFDINWFNEVYETLGKKRFEEIYKAAKYISDGAKHTRARKYADASRGEMDAKKTAEEIEKKRNKDLLMSYALIPCTDKERLERYSFIQKYMKEAKQFGAQRRASEKAAGEMAIKNLASASGYSDETRFILKMEREISSELAGFFEPHEVDEYSVWLEPDDAGKINVVVKKGDKLLKSMPAAIKKKDYVVDITEAKKTFTEQYRRTRIMMEEAMESETEFFVSEIMDMASDRVVGDMIGKILFMQGDFFGFPEDMKEAGLKDDSTVVVAHPYNLFKAGRWHEFQKLCFDKEIKQPFKQIFRELYVKTDEEKNSNESMRYAGNQINPKMTVGLLRGRRWVADEEDGLQKVYYKENIIATIYAMADWFSPSDIEAPTLEWVAFYDRKTFERKPINEVPEILFSEVMRDVDLAVSVAHAGDIDPEMSHSTIEMRRAIAEFVVPMFKLTNVTFTESHALIKGDRGNYNIHLGSGVIHQEGGPMINVLPVHSQHRGRIFLPFVDDDPKTAEIITKIIFFAEDKKIKDPFILDQIV